MISDQTPLDLLVELWHCIEFRFIVLYCIASLIPPFSTLRLKQSSHGVPVPTRQRQWHTSCTFARLLNI